MSRDEVIGTVALLAGSVLWFLYVADVIRAHPRQRLPMNFRRLPTKTSRMLWASAFCTTFFGAALASDRSYWGALLLVACVAPAFVAHFLHNRRVNLSR